ncbi:conserved hypothetical protein [Vibrio crassostreae]|uniref:Uncharacterized protein n=1 Tax=Vibrio crassostreae TaxID=246167 RepID=A0A822MUD8_9VIBR|nr:MULTISPECIES: hypothetical protein [Vibrio]MDH5936610.1 hypothetical protein [Vibrio splendidus]TCN05528.1 hypothetical protein EDB35_11624 [Vibrio crassostreae]CAK1763385.1 conserved hypothetical protein [Vibrio crassostreae]CAK1767600.1 conserved hypothetical protein [Vibrio crassostreae]CAK1779025.1 conserved hypothetical protein [Vibrio crassostreae]
MKFTLKTLLRGLLFSLWSLILSAACLFAYQQVFSPVQQESFDSRLDVLHQSLALTMNESRDKERQARIEALGALQFTLDDLTQRLDEQQGEITELMNIQSNQGARLDELGLDSKKLEVLETKLQRLSRQSTTKRATPVRAKPVVKPTVKTPTITAPFVLFDVQTRGHIQLAIVGKPGASTLAELSALQAGQHYLGWKITAVNDQHIEALYKGQRTTLTVGEG